MRIRRDDVLTPLLGLGFLAAGYWVAKELMQVPNRYKHFVVNRLAPQVISFFAGFPTGMVAASVLGATGPSEATVRSFAIGFQFALAFVGAAAAKYGLFPAPPNVLIAT